MSLLLTFVLLVLAVVTLAVITYRQRNERRQKLLAVTYIVVFCIIAALIIWLFIAIMSFSLKENREGDAGPLEPDPAISFPFH